MMIMTNLFPSERKLKMCEEILPLMCKAEDLILCDPTFGDISILIEQRKDLISILIEYCLEEYESSNRHDEYSEFKKKYEQWI